jgi:hypothetical protein
MALIAFIAIGLVVINCHCLLQLRLAPMLTLPSQLQFLLFIKLNEGNYHSMINSFYFIPLISDRPIDLD